MAPACDGMSRRDVHAGADLTIPTCPEGGIPAADHTRCATLHRAVATRVRRESGGTADEGRRDHRVRRHAGRTRGNVRRRGRDPVDRRRDQRPTDRLAVRGHPYATPDARFFTPWVLAVRPSESDARGAVVALRSAVSSMLGRRRATMCSGGGQWRLERGRDDAAGDAARSTSGDSSEATTLHRPRPTSSVHASPLVDETPAVPPPVPRYDETEYARWRTEVRLATREQRRLTPGGDFASKAGTDALAHQSLRA